MSGGEYGGFGLFITNSNNWLLRVRPLRSNGTKSKLVTDTTFCTTIFSVTKWRKDDTIHR